MNGLLLRTVNLDDAVRTDDRTVGATDAAVFFHNLKVIVTLCIYVFGKCDTLVGTACDTDGTTFALLRVDD